jgi:hypothetical protein
LANKILEKKSRSSYQSTPKGNPILDQILFSENNQSIKETTYSSNHIEYNSKSSHDLPPLLITKGTGGLQKNWSTGKLTKPSPKANYSYEKTKEGKYNIQQEILNSDRAHRMRETAIEDFRKIDLSAVTYDGHNHEEQWLNYLKLETPQLTERNLDEQVEPSFQSREIYQDIQGEIENLDKEIYEIQKYISHEINTNQNPI